MQQNPVTVKRLHEEHAQSLQLQYIEGTGSLGRTIPEPTVNRPGLVLSGFTRYFAHKRLQVIGNAEAFFLKSLPEGERAERCRAFFSHRIPCVVFSRNLNPDKIFLEAARTAKVPIFRTPLVTMKFINLATLALEMMFAPRGTEMGSMIDILGVGVILRGESGIGKSESVLALIERGYSLVADDITKVTLVDGRQVLGTSAEITRDHMEVRGIGIINVAAMFGVRSIRHEKRVDLVVSLRSWNEVQDVDRLGMEEQYVEILGIPIPHVIIPVRPGRDLARLVEVAAFQAKLKSSGYNPAKELNDRLIAQMASASPTSGVSLLPSHRVSARQAED
jgi:HPr kinase/phosphorylase